MSVSGVRLLIPSQGHDSLGDDAALTAHAKRWRKSGSWLRRAGQAARLVGSQLRERSRLRTSDPESPFTAIQFPFRHRHGAKRLP
jgi:hypothetical protein